MKQTRSSLFTEKRSKSRIFDEFQPMPKNVSKNDFKRQSSRTLNDVLKVYAIFVKTFSCRESGNFIVARAVNGKRPKKFFFHAMERKCSIFCLSV